MWQHPFKTFFDPSNPSLLWSMTFDPALSSMTRLPHTVCSLSHSSNESPSHHSSQDVWCSDTSSTSRNLHPPPSCSWSLEEIVRPNNNNKTCLASFVFDQVREDTFLKTTGSEFVFFKFSYSSKIVNIIYKKKRRKKRMIFRNKRAGTLNMFLFSFGLMRNYWVWLLLNNRQAMRGESEMMMQAITASRLPYHCQMS